MKSLCYSVFFLGLLFSCANNPPAFQDCTFRPFTSKEKGFIKRLESENIKGISLSRFNYNYRPGYEFPCENQQGVYSVISFTTPIEMYEDSIKLQTYLKGLIRYMYSELMNDSIKYYTPCVQLSFSTNERSAKFPKGTKVTVTALKEDIESYYGKKLVPGKHHLKWEKIKKVNDLKMCLTDSCADVWW